MYSAPIVALTLGCAHCRMRKFVQDLLDTQQDTKLSEDEKKQDILTGVTQLASK